MEVIWLQGYVWGLLAKKACGDCIEMLSDALELDVTFDDEEDATKEELSAKESFLALVNRGGFVKPSKAVSVTCWHA